MEFKNIDVWKNVMRKVAIQRDLDVQDVQQRYVLEEFAHKVSNSKYKHEFVLKGGFVVSTLLRLNTRMTRDLDFTYRSTILSKDDIKDIIQEIIDTPFDSFFDYFLVDITHAQADDYQSGFIVKLEARQAKSVINLKLDISNNTLIYPKPIFFPLNSLFSNEVLNVNTYPLENIIAEKFETTLDRGEFNGRMRDLVDVYSLMKSNLITIDNYLLAKTIIKVFKDRDTLENLTDFDEIIQSLKSSKIFNDNFVKYIKNQYFDIELTLDDVFDEFKRIHRMIVDFKV